MDLNYLSGNILFSNDKVTETGPHVIILDYVFPLPIRIRARNSCP